MIYVVWEVMLHMTVMRFAVRIGDITTVLLAGENSVLHASPCSWLFRSVLPAPFLLLLIISPTRHQGGAGLTCGSEALPLPRWPLS